MKGENRQDKRNTAMTMDEGTNRGNMRLIPSSSFLIDQRGKENVGKKANIEVQAE